MTKFDKLIIASIFLLISGGLIAQYIPPGSESTNRWVDVIDGQSLSTSPCFSWTRPGQSEEAYINVGGYSQMSLNTKLTRGSGDGTYFGVRCWGLVAGGDGTIYQIQGGTAASIDSNTDLVLTYANQLIKRSIGNTNTGANNEAWEIPVPINDDYIKCCYESDSTTGDVINVTVRASGKGGR